MSNTVKLSKSTHEILKNFASINTNVLIQEGKVLRTRAVNKSILAEATKLEEGFPQEFPIYNLGELLNVISLFKEPSLDFDGKLVTIQESSGKGMKIKYMASSKLILDYPDKEVKEPSYEVLFRLGSEDLENIFKSAAAINGPDIQVIGNADGITVRVTDKATPTSNDASFVVGTEPQDEPFTFNFRTESLKIMPGNYEVSISSKLLAKFKNEDKPGLVWFVPCEKDSKYGE
jgi:hypothetical protein